MEIDDLSSASLAITGRILVFVGGILVVISGALHLFEVVFTVLFSSLLENLGVIGRGSGIVSLILGIIAITCARYSNRLVWAIIFIIIGFLAGELGGLLVLVGGILGLVSFLIKKT